MPTHPPRKRPLARVERRFEQSRLQARLVADAYELLVPLLRQPLPSRPGRPGTLDDRVAAPPDHRAIGA